MCPFCLATAAIIAGSATGTGGVAAVIANKFRKRKSTKEISAEIETKEERYGYEHDGSAAPEGGLARSMD